VQSVLIGLEVLQLAKVLVVDSVSEFTAKTLFEERLEMFH
jgi:hypothetical protein